MSSLRWRLSSRLHRIRAARLESLEERRLLALSPVLVADIETSQLASRPSDFTPAGDWTYFLAEDVIHGRELWRTDGTEQGTSLVADLTFGRNDSWITEMTPVGSQLFFALDGDLWKTDGTAEGTVRLRNFAPSSSNPSQLTHLTAAGDRLFFVGYEPTQRPELWVSDGTEAGTIPLTANSEVSTFIDYQFLAGDENGVFGLVKRSGDVQELWKSDGSSAGTSLVRSFNGGVGYEDFAIANGVLLFSAYDPAIGSRPWRSDGAAAGTQMLADIAPSDFGLFGWEFTKFGDSIVFRGYDADEQDVAWITDGTPDGTRKLIESSTNDYGGSPHLFTPLGDSLYFVAEHDDFGQEVWRYDGATEVATMIADVFPEEKHAHHRRLAATAGTLYYAVEIDHEDDELWATDGTAVGTRQLLGPVVDGREFSTVNDQIVFRARSTDGDSEPWVSDGTHDGTHRLMDINTGSAGSGPGQFTPLGDYLYFTAYSSTEGARGLWRTPIGGLGAELIKGDFPATNESEPQNLTAVGDQLFFTVRNRELWVSDGTEAGTKFLRDLLPSGGSARIRGLFELDGQLFVLADDGRQLWTSNGTPEGTVLLKQFETGEAEIWKPAFLRDELHFFVTLAFNSYEHWKTDGTAAGTQFIQPINTLGGLSDNIKEMVSDGERLYFSARNTDSAVTLWTSDGTAAGTHRVAESQSVAVDPKNMTLLGSQLYFTATNPATGYELWRSDGTSDGTALVGDLLPGAQSSFPGQFTVVGDSLYFTSTGFQSRYLWQVDASHVQRVEFVEPFQQLTWMYALTAVRGAVFFAGQRAGIGTELWRADANGIEIVPGALPGPASAIPSTSASSFINVGDHFYYAANDLRTGVELRRLTIGDGDTNFDGEVNLEDLNNVRNHFGKSGGALGDANGDGAVDLADLNAVRNHFGSAGAVAPTNWVQRVHSKATDAVFQLHREELPLAKKAAKRASR